MSDLINRQTAVEALYSILFDDDMRPTIVSAKQADEIIDAIRKAPSALLTIEPRHGLLIPDATLPRKGCYHCMFREGNLCKFLPASVPVVECGKRYERHKECPLVEV